MNNTLFDLTCNDDKGSSRTSSVDLKRKKQVFLLVFHRINVISLLSSKVSTASIFILVCNIFCNKDRCFSYAVKAFHYLKSLWLSFVFLSIYADQDRQRILRNCNVFCVTASNLRNCNVFE